MEDAIFADSKQERQVAVDKIKEEAATACEEKFGEDYDEDHVKMAFEVIQEEVYRENILDKGKRRWSRTCRSSRNYMRNRRTSPCSWFCNLYPWRNPVTCS